MIRNSYTVSATSAAGEAANEDRAGPDRLQEAVHERITMSGERTISITDVRGRRALRLVAVSPAVTFDALRETVDVARAVAAEIAG